LPAIQIPHIAAAGVVGAGGAGFPTHVKLSAKADSVLLNGAECEPLLHKDKEILRHYGPQIVQGVRAAMDLVGAERGLVGIKKKYTDVIEALRPLLGPGMDVRPLSDSYPAGDEMILVYDLLGRVVPPGGLPLHVGAVVINVETALNVARSPERPVTEKFVSVAGAVAEPCTLRVPVGTSLAECVEAAGGAQTARPHYLVGGVMMGRLVEDLSAPVTKTTAAVVVLPDEHVVVRRYQREWKAQVRIGRSACDQCSFCTELCPRYLLGHPIEPHKAMRSLGFNLVGESNVIGTSFCCECNLCSLFSCPEDLDPKEVCAQNKRRIASEGQRWQDPPFNPKRPELHLDDRRVPMQRLMQRLGLTRFRNVGPLRPDLLQPRRVALPLKQHVGAPCQPAVLLGARVRVGDVVGSVPLQDGKPALGVPVHASIDGRVTALQDGAIWIEA
jgi:cobalamin reductase